MWKKCPDCLGSRRFAASAWYTGSSAVHQPPHSPVLCISSPFALWFLQAAVPKQHFLDFPLRGAHLNTF